MNHSLRRSDYFIAREEGTLLRTTKERGRRGEREKGGSGTRLSRRCAGHPERTVRSFTRWKP